MIPLPPSTYQQEDQRRLRNEIRQMDRQNLKRQQDVELTGVRLILSSPDGSRFQVVVDDLGALSTVAL